VVILAIQFLIKGVQSFWPAIVGVSLTQLDWMTLLLIPFGISLGVAWAILYYLRFTYWVEEGSIIVERGVIQRERLQVPFQKIQAINLFQGPVQQVFGLTGIQVDTAGSSGSEFKIVAMRREAAESLRLMLAEQGAAPDGTRDPGKEAMTVEAGPVDSSHAYRGRTMVDLDIARLVKVGLTQNHLRNGLLGLAVISSLVGGLEHQIESWLSGLPAPITALIAAATVLLIVPGFILMLLTGVGVSLVTTVLRYFGFHSEIGRQGVFMESGLLRRNTFQIPFDKIQLTDWRSNALQRALGFETLRIRQAQAGDAASGVGVRLAIPAMEPEHRATMEEVLYPDLDQGVVMTGRPVGRLRWLLWFAALLPGMAPFSFWSPWAAWTFMALWLPFTGWTTLKRYRSFHLTVYRDAVVLQKGWFWRQRVILKMSQLQGVEWKRHLLLERRGVGHLTFHTASGAKRFSYLDKQTGFRIRDWALNQLHVNP
jgi:putative membrane protein